jgi:HEAT repeat protein
MKMAALKALGDIGESVAADAVFAAVADDPSPVVRSSAASALRALGDPRTVDILVSILAGEATGHAKRWAASEIVALDAVHALPAVEAAASRSSPFVAWCLRRSAKALRDKTGK